MTGEPVARTSGARWPGPAVALVVILLDQATKWWILEVVMQPPRVIPLTSFFNLVMGWNRGVSFGLLDSDSPFGPFILSVVALVIIAVLAVWIVRAHRLSVVIALGLVIGGAAGNVVDRVRFGAVADFLDFHLGGLHWPAFNVADGAITAGAVVLVLESLFVRQETRKIQGQTGDNVDGDNVDKVDGGQ